MYTKSEPFAPQHKTIQVLNELVQGDLPFAIVDSYDWRQLSEKKLWIDIPEWETSQLVSSWTRENLRQGE